MKKHLILILVAIALGASQKQPLPLLDTVYLYYANQEYTQAYSRLEQLGKEKLSPSQRFLYLLEVADYYLDKARDYARAESLYQQIINEYPKHSRMPDVLYRLALAQELQEKFMEAAKNYEQVATRYFKSPYGQDALDAIERCFRKNYQERVAYVNNYPITRIELDDRISRNPAAYESFAKKLALLDTMIDNRLLYEAALRSDIVNNPEIIQNLTDTRNRMMFQLWYDINVTKKAEPKEKELRAIYKKNRTKYTTPEKVHAFQLVVTSKPLADSLYAALIKDTTKWDSLVKLYSIAPDRERGGDMGVFARGVYPREIENTAFRLKQGEISPPVTLKDTYYIIKVTSKEPSKLRPYEEVKNQIAVELRQERTNQLYEQEIARLKKTANLIQDTLAIEQDKETLAVVNGVPITQERLQARLNSIPPFFRAQFETPEGKRRILDQLIVEKLLLRECEKEKYWLANRVVDQWLNRRANLFIDAYRRSQTTGKVQLDSATLMAEYQASIKDFKEPTRVRCREMVARTRAKAEQLRNWALAGRIPTLISGVAFLVPDETKANELATILTQTANLDSMVALGALASASTRIKGLTTHLIGGSNILDISEPCKLAGPFLKGDFISFAFSDLAPQERIYNPELIEITTSEMLNSLLTEGTTSGPTLEPFDSTRLGTYVRLASPLPSGFFQNLFKLETGKISTPYKTSHGYLIVRITKKDTAQKVEFTELIRRFSTSGSKWAGGVISLTPDDKARDAKVVKAAYSTSKGNFSPVIKIDDTTYTFIQIEEKKPAYTRPFSEVRSKIENKLRREREKELYDELIRSLRAQAKIEILLKEEDFRGDTIEQEPIKEK